MSHIRNTAACRLHTRNSAGLTEDLNEKPESDQERRGNNGNAGEPPQHKQRA